MENKDEKKNELTFEKIRRLQKERDKDFKYLTLDEINQYIKEVRNGANDKTK